MMYLREMTEQDLPLMMAWRSSPLVYAGFYQQTRPLIWEEHFSWWESRNSDWRSFLCLYDDRPIGVVNIGQLDHFSPEIGYFIGEVSLWGQGLGVRMVSLGLMWLRRYSQEHKHITHVHTTIKDDNKSSIKLIKKLGFNRGMKARKGESYWVRSL